MGNFIAVKVQDDEKTLVKEMKDVLHTRSTSQVVRESLRHYHRFLFSGNTTRGVKITTEK